MKLPSFFCDYAAGYFEDDYVNFTITLNGNDYFDIWYYGDLYAVGGTEYIVATEEAPAKIVAKSAEGEILLFDGASFGYDNMFCDTFTEAQINDRPLKKLDIPPVKVNIKLGYSIDYEDEKEEYDADENDRVTLINGKQIPWAQVITDGFDYINISVTTKDGQTREIGDAELA